MSISFQVGVQGQSLATRVGLGHAERMLLRLMLRSIDRSKAVSGLLFVCQDSFEPRVHFEVREFPDR